MHHPNISDRDRTLLQPVNREFHPLTQHASSECEQKIIAMSDQLQRCGEQWGILREASLVSFSNSYIYGSSSNSGGRQRHADEIGLTQSIALAGGTIANRTGTNELCGSAT